MLRRFFAPIDVTEAAPSSTPTFGPRDLRVGVNADLARTRQTTGHGRVWGAGIHHLSRAATIIRDLGDYASIPRPDVWLLSGHSPVASVPEPVVALVYEARWAEPNLATDLDPAFLSWIGPNTAQAMQQATRVLTLSFASARNIARLGISADRIDVVHLGVDLDIFSPGLTGGRELVAARTGDDRPYIISVASLFRGKNLPLLCRAAARLSARGFPHRLVLVTQPSGDRTDPAAALAELQGRDGPRPEIFENVTEAELAALIAGAAAFCLPSRFEGFGLPALEALACGVPVIVSDGGALPELVADAGLIVEPTESAIERALAEVIQDGALARSLAIKGRRRAEAFAWERTIQGWMLSLTRAAEVRQTQTIAR